MEHRYEMGKITTLFELPHSSYTVHKQIPYADPDRMLNKNVNDWWTKPLSERNYP